MYWVCTVQYRAKDLHNNHTLVSCDRCPLLFLWLSVNSLDAHERVPVASTVLSFPSFSFLSVNTIHHFLFILSVISLKAHKRKCYVCIWLTLRRFSYFQECYYSVKAQTSTLSLGKYQEVALMTDLTIGRSILVLRVLCLQILTQLSRWRNDKNSDWWSSFIFLTV